MPSARTLPASLALSLALAAAAGAGSATASALPGPAAPPRVAPGALSDGATDAWWSAVEPALRTPTPPPGASALPALPDWTAESDLASAEFGFSVAAAGDVNGDGYGDVIVGAHFASNGQAFEGRAYVFHGSATGLGLVPAWTAEGDQASADFGYSVATAGDVNGDGYSDVIIGARAYDNGENDEGRAFVYHGSAAGLGPIPAWIAEGNQAGAWFGWSVGPAGDVNGDGFGDVIVGAYAYDNGQTNEGRAFVYLGHATGLSALPDWTAEGDVTGAHFGAAVAAAGDVNGDGYADVVIGAPNFTNGQQSEGRAVVYLGTAGGPAAAPAWSAEGNQASAWFGTSVGTAGDVNGDGFSDVIVGAYGWDNGQADEGRALVYHGSAGGVALAPAWTAESDQASAQFGLSVGTAGDVDGDGYADVIVGAPLFDDAAADEGRAFVYRGGANGLQASPAWSAGSGQGTAWLGCAVATAGDVNGDGFSDVVTGARYFDNGQTNEGRAFAFLGAGTGTAQTAAWTEEGGQAFAWLGYSVASAGDVNGDGYGDVIVGAPDFRNPDFIDRGAALLYHGSATGASVAPDVVLYPQTGGADFGICVASAGDVNGDGYGDVIVGDRLALGTGRASVYHGSPAGLGSAPDWSVDGDQFDCRFGGWAASAGDVNGDGYGDVIVGAYYYDAGESDEGRAFVYHGSAAGLHLAPDWTAEGNQANAYFGHPVACAGDVNGDGYSDVVVGAPYHDEVLDDGRAYVFHGSPVGLHAVADRILAGNAQAKLGYSAATAGDVNGDGYADVIVGCRGSLLSGETVRVHPGSPAGIDPAPLWGALSGRCVASAGDVDGDGFSDVITGEEYYSNGQSIEGRALLVLGSATGPAPAPQWSVESNQTDANYGFSVAGAGDVNGDGYADVIVGAPTSDGIPPLLEEGRAFLYLGNGGAGRVVLPRQQHTDGATPIAPLGRSNSETQFRIRAVMLSAFGRTRLQMEHEVKPLGVPFDGVETVPGSFFDIGSDGIINFNRLVSGLAPSTGYHWRVRAKYDLVKTPYQRNGPWVHPPGNGWNETDLRTDGPVGTAVAPPDPGSGAAAFALLAWGRSPSTGPHGVRLSLPRGGPVDADVVNVAGRRVAVLADGAPFEAGSHMLVWDGRDRAGIPAAAGVYFLRVRAGGEVRTAKLVRVR